MIALDRRTSVEWIKALSMVLDTYKKPVAKTAIKPNFLLRGRCSFQRPGTGSIKIVKSDITLIIPVA